MPTECDRINNRRGCREMEVIQVIVALIFAIFVIGLVFGLPYILAVGGVGIVGFIAGAMWSACKWIVKGILYLIFEIWDRTKAKIQAKKRKKMNVHV